jgi:chemotaxis protein CheX
MEAKDIQAFIDVVTSYFKSISGEPAEMGVPYVLSSVDREMSVTARIAVSGSHRGQVLFSTGEGMLGDLGRQILGNDIGRDEMSDMAGEVINTIAGNMRRHLGSRYFISVPAVSPGFEFDSLFEDAPPAFMVPLKWRGNTALLVIGLR